MNTSYVLVGDSQAVGLRRHLRDVLAPKGFVEVGAAVHEGWSTRRMVDSGEAAALLERRPDLAIVVLGGNDTATSAYPNVLGRLVAQLKRGRTQVVWIGPAAVGAGRPSIAERKREVHHAQAEVLPALGVRWLNGHAMTAGLEHAPDGLHFGRASLRTWAERIASQLEPRVTLPAVLGVAAGLVLGGVTLWLWRLARR